jgi:hypothetical protein
MQREKSRAFAPDRALSEATACCSRRDAGTSPKRLRARPVTIWRRGRIRREQRGDHRLGNEGAIISGPDQRVFAVSYAADLALGQPMAHCMRQTVIALRLGDLAGASERELEAIYYLGLMMNVYCHADAAEQAQWFGDDISLKGDGVEMLDMSTARTISFILRRVNSHGSGVRAPGGSRRSPWWG